MAKKIVRIVLTGGPAAGKTTLISRIIKEFKPEDGWRVITIPETATDLISGFRLGPFPGCMSMEQFQYFVIPDQLHKEQLALRAAEVVPEEKVLIVYDRAIFDDLAYINEEQFEKTLAAFGHTPGEILAGYNAVLHLVSCAKGAEFAYGHDNTARYEDVNGARAMDDRTLQAWSQHPNLYVIDNSVDFEDKMNRAIAQIYEIIGEKQPVQSKRKLLIVRPDAAALRELTHAEPIDMMQTYLVSADPCLERRIRQQRNGDDYLYFYTEKRTDSNGRRITEKTLSAKEYAGYLMECDSQLHPVKKQKYRFTWAMHRCEIDIYPASPDRAILFSYGIGGDEPPVPDGITVLKDVTGLPEYKNRRLAENPELRDPAETAGV